MNRRELFRMFGAGAVVPALSPQFFALLQQAQPGAGYKLRTLSPQQNDTVVAMIDQILPATDTPGAKAVRVNEFIDVILTEWATPEERAKVLAGLADVDKQSNELYGKAFTAATSAQQVALLHAIEAVSLADPDVHPEHRKSRNWQEPDRQLAGDFWMVFKGMTLHGYYTSEVGFTEELKLLIIPGALHGCSPAVTEKKA